MAVIGSLVLALKTKSKKFNKGLKSARKRLGRFASSVRASAIGIAKFGAVLGAAALAGLAFYVGKAFKAIDATAKLADRLNISTKALTGLQLAANLAGVENEVFNKGLEKMIRNIGETAKLGTGDAKDAFKALGLEVNALNSMSADQQFLTIADAISKMGTQSEKAAVAAKVFGRAGVQLLNVLTQNKKALQDVIKQNERLGGSFSRIDASKVEQANDALTRLGLSLKGLVNRIAIQVAPTIVKMANVLTEVFVVARNTLIPVFIEMGTSITKNIGGAVLGVIPQVRDLLISMEFAFTHIPDLAKLAFLKVGLLGQGFARDIVFTYTELLPKAIKGFARFMVDAFKQAFRFVKEQLGSMVTTFVNVFTNLPGLIAGTVKFSDLIDFRDFEFSFAKLPKLAVRQLSPLEKAIADEIKELQKRLDKSFTKLVFERTRQFAKLGKALSNIVAQAFVPFEIPSFDVPDIPGAGAMARRLPSVGAFERGSQGAASAITKARQSGPDGMKKVERKTEKNTKKTAENTGRLLTALDEMTRQRPAVVEITR